MAVVTLDRVSKVYDRSSEPAVDDVSFTVSDGEFMVLLGPSGCGKSTTLRMIAGLESISNGALTIDGARMNEVPAKDRDIAMVFQSYALYPHMTVHENLAFGLRRRGFSRREIERRARQAAEMLELSHFANRKPHALSGGQRQRVALGRAIVRDPKVFLFDEPLSNLDAALRVSTRGELIKQHQRLGATMVYVTHDQVEAMTMGARICIMDAGRVVQIGPPMEIYHNPADTFVASFLGSPPMNLFPAVLDGDGGRMVVRLGGHPLTLPDALAKRLDRGSGAPVTLGIRAEDLYERTSPEATVPFAELPVHVTTIEPLGAETLVIAVIEGTGEELTARISRDASARPGDDVKLQADLSTLRLFDPNSGAAL